MTQKGFFQSLFNLLIGSIIWTVSYQIFGELLGSWVTHDLSLFAAMILTSYFIFVPGGGRKSEVYTLKFATSFLCLGLAWVFLYSLRETTLINFFGYGYDNYAHLAQARLIVANQGTAFLSTDQASWPTFLQDQSQAPAALIATFSEIIAPNSGIYSSLRVLIVATFCIPATAVIGSISLFWELQRNKRAALLISILVAIFVLTGYFSRIWLSGYFASNLGTIILIFISLAVIANEFDKPEFFVWPVMACLHCYPLLGVISGLIALPTIISLLLKRMNQTPRPLAYLFRWQHIFPVLFGTSILLPYIATRRSYGASQFLVDGGIEPIPMAFFGFWIFFFFVLPSIIIFSYRGSWGTLFVVVGAFTMAAMISWYSISRRSYMAYYPIKIVIALSFVLVFCSMVATLKYLTGNAQSFGIALLAFAGLSYVFFFPSAKLFTSGYMGDLPTTLKSAYTYETAVVQPSAVAYLADLSAEISKPVLYLPENAESELNTRWINTLSGFWNDSSWSGWSVIRSDIMEGKFQSAVSLMSTNGVFLATDDLSVFKEISSRSPQSACLIGSGQNCVD